MMRSKKSTTTKKVRQMNGIKAVAPTKAQISVPLNHSLSYCSNLKFNWIELALVAWGIGAENT
jgi:hypothetical protein